MLQPFKPNLIYIVTSSFAVRLLLRGQLRYMREHGFQITVIASPGPGLRQDIEEEGVDLIEIPIQREIALLHDVISLWRIYCTLRQLKPDIVNASEPKAGLLGMIAAMLANVPVRIYLLRGLRTETLTGLSRIVVDIAEKITALCAHSIVSVSDSLKHVYLKNGFASSRKLYVLGQGSSNGIDPKQFLANVAQATKYIELREKIGIPADSFVIGFVGRLTKDKGVVNLVEAFLTILKHLPNTYLLLLGRYEKEDPLPDHVVHLIQYHPNIKHAGHVQNPALYYHIMDVFTLPSYREGMPKTPLEAALASIPSVGFAATGVIDAIQDGKTGLIVPVGDTVALARGLLTLLENDMVRQQMGRSAQERVLKDFQPEHVWQHWLNFYNGLYTAKNNSTIQ